VLAKECLTADALATACMVLDVEKSVALIESLAGVEAMFIYSKEDGSIDEYITAGAKSLITLKEKQAGVVE
jgi:thiamine biosynthesis lipoprotein